MHGDESRPRHTAATCCLLHIVKEALTIGVLVAFIHNAQRFFRPIRI